MEMSLSIDDFANADKSVIDKESSTPELTDDLFEGDISGLSKDTVAQFVFDR